MIKQQNHYHPSKTEKSLEFGTKEHGTKLVQRILQELQNPILYITGENGRTYRPNRRDLLKLRDLEPLQMQCDIEPKLDNTNLENNNEPLENCPTTITISNNSEKTPITQ